MPGPRQCCPCPGGWRWLPALRWLPRYSLAWLQLDLMAGLTVGLTVVPQALAYAEVAGLPLQYGLYSSFTGCFVYCFLGTAKDVTLGPTAIMSLLVSSYAFHEPVYAVLLAFLSGCIQLAMGLLHLGFLLDFISCPVIKGFTSAASITISFNQVKNILGLQGIPRQFFLQVYETLRRIGETRAGDAVLGLACLAALAGLQAMKSRLPRAAGAEPLAARVSYLIVWTTATARNALVVLFAGLVAYSFQVMGSQPLTLTGSIPRGLPAFRLPRFSMAAPNGTVPFRSMVEGDLCPLVVTLTVSFPPRTWGSGWPWSRSWACWRPLRLPRLLPLRTVTGLTPTRSCWLWALPTSWDPLSRRIPSRAALAGLDLVPLCVTFLLCFWEVQYGIVAGVLVSGILLLYSIARPPIKVLEGDVLVVQPGSSLHFPAVECLRDAICSRALAAPSPPRSIILDCHHISSIDYTAVVGLAELLQELHNHSLSLAFCSVQDTVLQVLLSADLEGFQHFPSLEEAERAAGAESEGGRAAPFTSTSQSSLLPTGLIQ
ncbi:sodium-independent sulfate anion transporter isoform X4 [Apus apus]|uniref:sodium-independent sulfate anion transporter isoform X4 n=1 Tax=Apus apus TaxID=8895 RepID=UPI0021F88913|nr:sodium-independent sulfate anion transporter isoform X4 [Apus apus]